MRSFLRSFALAFGIMMAIAVHVRAEITSPVEFTTSFPFVVGNTTVPAGSYTIRPDEDNPNIMELNGPQIAVLFDVRPASASAAQPPAKTEVVFTRYGDGYVLKSVWVEGSAIGAESVTAEAEKHQVKRGAAAGEQRIPGKKKS